MTHTRLISLSTVALALALAFVFNPSAQKHRDAIRLAVKDVGAFGIVHVRDAVLGGK
jgi:hypothetical protein